MLKIIDLLHEKIFSKKNIKNFEIIIHFFAVSGFLIHLMLVFLNLKYEINYFVGLDNLLSNPISGNKTSFVG